MNQYSMMHAALGQVGKGRSIKATELQRKGRGLRGPDGDLQDGDLQLSDSALLRRKCLKAAAGLARLGDEEKKNPHQPAQPAPRVRVSGGWENPNLYLHPHRPVPMTRTGYITCDFP
jgi:hypothetical protein